MISSLFSCQTSLLSITKPKFVHLFNSFSLDHDWFVVWFLSSKIYDHFLCLPHIQYKIVFLAPIKKSVNFLSVVRSSSFVISPVSRVSSANLSVRHENSCSLLCTVEKEKKKKKKRKKRKKKERKKVTIQSLGERQSW